jgi:uncharacterized protein YjbI with pentapeptide repeats
MVEISFLLGILNSPWALAIGKAIPLGSSAVTVGKWAYEKLKQEPSVEECVVVVTQAAYLASWQAELARNLDRFAGIDRTKASKQIDRNFKPLADIDRAAANKIVTALPSSELVQYFNAILVERLLDHGVNQVYAINFADRVAWETPRYVNEMVAEHADKIKVLAEVYRNGGKDVLAHYASIDEYLKNKIEPLPFEKVFDEPDLQLQEIYVELEIERLETSGEKNTSASPQLINEWANDKLLDPKSKAILFIQGEAGRGKSVFCRMFADFVRRELAFTPILIRLRDIKTLGDNLTKTLENCLENDGFTKDKYWLTNKNQRFLFLLDGFDELILQGRSTGGLKEFIGQVEIFQAGSHHRILITGRHLAMQGIEESIFQNNQLERVKLLPMNDNIRGNWLYKWEVKFGQEKTNPFVDFLNACPLDIHHKLARDPLLLYVLARIHREGAITVAHLSGTSAMASKVKVYDRTIEWVLEKQRDDLNRRIFGYGLEIDELRQLLTEVGVCVIQSGNEIAKVTAIEYRLTKDEDLKKLFDKIRGTVSDNNKALNNLLTTFYIQPAQSDKEGSVEFAHKSFGEFLFAESIKESIAQWSSVTTERKRTKDKITQKELEWQIYDLFGSGCLTPDIVDYLREMLRDSSHWQPLRLFKRLNQFWESWCEGEFIDAQSADNLPQKKMNALAAQMPDREKHLGIRQVDVYTGLNILILLLELHRYSQSRAELKSSIFFYPSGKSESDSHTTRLLKIIHYSESIEIPIFTQNVGFFLSDADLSSANLSGANLSDANLSGANLSGVYLSDANLSGANLSDADLSGANLSGANLSSANLSGANFSDANLSGANLSGANLSGANLIGANLSGANLSGANLSGTNFRVANFSDANFRGANFSGANFYEVNFSGANFRGANFLEVNFSDANFRGANFLEVNFSGADFRGADLYKVNFNEVNLSGANLSGANLCYANFSFANFNFANLSRANLRNAKLSGANIRNADLIGADFSFANLSGANLSGAKLSGTNLTNVQWDRFTTWRGVIGLATATIPAKLKQHLGLS